MVKRLSQQRAHLRDITLLILQKYDVHCSLCGRAFTAADFPARATDLLTEHHIDGDHSNASIENRVVVHRSCHKSYHMWLRRSNEKGSYLLHGSI